MRRTINLPDGIDEQVRENAAADESFSAAVTRLIEAGLRSLGKKRPPAYVGSFDGPGDLGLKAEEYLRDLARSR
jgi:hypothetical protein